MSDRSEAWSDYLASAHRLDAVRRDAASAALAEAEAVTAARAEIPVIQARLALQAGRLLEAALEKGVTPPPLVPGPAEQHIARNTVAGGPTVALAALRQARSTVDVADSALARVDETPRAQAIRNLIAYGPAALVAVFIQVGFAVLVDDRTQTFYAAVCGLTMAAIFYGIAWILLGIIHPRQPKTPEIGAMVCAAPVILVALLFAIT